MALSTSISKFRQIYRISSSSTSSTMLRWNFPFFQSSRSSSFPFDDGKSSPPSPPLTSPKLFVSGLSRLTTDEKLKAAFEPYGQLVEAKVITDRVSGRSKGFGFITYASVAEAEKAREGMNAKFLDGWVIFVDPAKPKQPRPLPQQEPLEDGIRSNKTIGWCG